MPQPMLKIDQLSKRFGDRQVLDRLCLKIQPGEIYGLLGANGAGKTTLINIICRLINGDQGQIEIDGLGTSPQTRALIGIAPQENLLYYSLSCRENLDFFAALYGLQGKAKAQQIDYCLAAVNLADRATSLVGNLSGGMARRLNMAIALIHSPKLVILDEPTTGLDIEARYEIWSLIQQLRDRGITLLLTTHLLEEAERLCQRIGILKQGRIVVEGDLAQLRQVIPAAEILFMRTPQEPQAIAIAQRHNFTVKRYGQDLAFWLPEPKSMAEIIYLFAEITIDSLALQPVRLENIYLEITGDTSYTSLANPKA
ncbi:MAG: ABC transporter ATP-binding protein [Pseudanabaenaceae cyanobacterium bins.68]|nr:ABC transporter ATP-binding protein [Pseudanabaenaceae cyanobacterium bins.68]